MSDFRSDFISSDNDMMVLIGTYEGNPLQNSYGRIIRAKAKDDKGTDSGKDSGNVIQIMEFKDIMALSEDMPYKTVYRKKTYSFTKQELIRTKEFNSGVYAFKYN